MEIVRFCVYCDNEVTGSYCKHCQDNSGVVEGYIDEQGYHKEFVKAVCSKCQELSHCIEIDKKYICLECLREE